MSDDLGHQHERHYSMNLKWDPEDRVYVVMVPELPGCLTHGSSYEEAVRQGQDAINSWIDANLQEGRRIPKPRLFKSEDLEASLR
jgi:antitoxin HicB